MHLVGHHLVDYLCSAFRLKHMEAVRWLDINCPLWRQELPTHTTIVTVTITKKDQDDPDYWQ